MEMTTIAILLGMVLGTLMLLSACWVYLKYQKFGLGGLALTCFGVVLIGLSIWKTIDVSVTKEGIKAKFTQLEGKLERTEEDSKRLSNDFTRMVRETIAYLKEENKKAHLAVSPVPGTSPREEYLRALEKLQSVEVKKWQGSEKEKGGR